MTKEQLFEMLDNSIDSIHEHFCDEECEWILTDQLRGNAHFPIQNWVIENGISKAVLLIKGESFVVKFPFYCLYENDNFCDDLYDWEEARDNAFAEAIAKKEAKGEEPILTQEEADILNENFKAAEPDSSNDKYYTPIEGASYYISEDIQISEDWNYCELECAIYEEAVKRGLGMYFAEERLMGTLTCSGLPVYYQTRCTPLCNLEYDYASAEYERKSEKAHLTCKELDAYCFNPLWIADFVEQYGKEEFRRLSLFLDEMCIGDLRDCNIGYLDGAPILFDYSGFRHWD